MDQPMNTKDPLHVSNWSITRSKAKALKEALNGLVMRVLAKAKLMDHLEYQEEALVHLIYMQEGPNPPLFWPWSFNNKAANIVSVSTSLVLWCLYMYGFLTSFEFPIMCGKINYFFYILGFIIFILFFLSSEEKTQQMKQRNLSWLRKHTWQKSEALNATSFSFQKKDKYKAKIRILF
jgi:hypothetical protein